MKRRAGRPAFCYCTVRSRRPSLDPCPSPLHPTCRCPSTTGPWFVVVWILVIVVIGIQSLALIWLSQALLFLPLYFVLFRTLFRTGLVVPGFVEVLTSRGIIMCSDYMLRNNSQCCPGLKERIPLQPKSFL